MTKAERTELLERITHLGYEGRASEAKKLWVDHAIDLLYIAKAYFDGACWKSAGDRCHCATCEADRNDD